MYLIDTNGVSDARKQARINSGVNAFFADAAATYAPPSTCRPSLSATCAAALTASAIAATPPKPACSKRGRAQSGTAMRDIIPIDVEAVPAMDTAVSPTRAIPSASGSPPLRSSTISRSDLKSPSTRLRSISY
jgi:hypothetical protein